MTRYAPHILLAQVDESSTMLLAAQLLHEEFCVSTRRDGRTLAEEIQNGAPRQDLLLLDFSLPYYSGLQILQLTRGTAGWKHIPVILLSDQVEESHEILAFRSGATDYVQKPLRTGALVARIRARLAEHKENA